MPKYNGVGLMSAAFGSGRIAYPFKGSYIVNFLPSSILATGSNVTGWQSIEGNVLLAPVSTPQLGLMPNGISKCVTFSKTEAMTVVSSRLGMLNGTNTPFEMAFDLVLDSSESGTPAIIYLSDAGGAAVELQWYSTTVIPRGSLVRFLTPNVTTTLIPNPFTLGTRFIVGVALDNTGNLTAYSCNPTTGAITVGIPVAQGGIGNLVAIASLTLNGLVGTAGGNACRFSSLWIRPPTVPTPTGTASEITTLLQYIQANPNL